LSNKRSPILSTNSLTVAARSTPLSEVQVEEILYEAQLIHPDLEFETTLVTTIGDRDQATSLRTLEKTDFFTRDIDQLVLNGYCRIAVHSAKDLPEPIPDGLKIVAVNQGLDPSDSLVMRPGDSLSSLPKGAKIATSSIRREEMVRSLRPDFEIVDIRGNIGQRLKKLEDREVDGVIMAEAALIRLNLIHLNREHLDGETAPGQGRLAVVAREDDAEAAAFFAIMDQRPTAVYLGLKPPKDTVTTKFHHCPIIEIVPKIRSTRPLPHFTHIVFTSKSAVRIYCCYFDPKTLMDKTVIAVGKQTAQGLIDCGVDVDHIPDEESSEGLIALLQTLDLQGTEFFWPHSALSRPVITNYLTERKIPFTEWVVYTTIPRDPTPLPAEFHELVFTSPSTVDAFLLFFDEFPENVKLTPIGPVTEQYLSRVKTN